MVTIISIVGKFNAKGCRHTEGVGQEHCLVEHQILCKNTDFIS